MAGENLRQVTFQVGFEQRTKNLKDADKQVDELKRSVMQLDREIKDVDTSSDKAFKDMSSDVNNASTTMTSLSSNVRGFNQNMSTSRTATAGFANTMETLVSGPAIFAAIGFAAVQAGRDIVGAVKEFAQFSEEAFVSMETGLSEIRTILPGITDQQFGAFEDQIIDLSREMGIMTDQAIPGVYQAISAGVPDENVLSFMETAIEAQIGGLTDLRTSVDILTTITNSYGNEIITAEHASDLLFATVREGKTTFDELGRFLFQVIPAASAVGVDLENVGAAMATITTQGTPTRVAATQLRQAILELSKDGAQANEIFEIIAGQSFPDFIKNGGNLVDAFGMLDSAALQVDAKISDLFTSVEAGLGALQLTGAGAEIFAENFEEMQNVAGATGDAFEIMNDTTARSTEASAARTEIAAAEIFSHFDNLNRDLIGIKDRMKMDFFDAIDDEMAELADFAEEKLPEVEGLFESLADLLGTGAIEMSVGNIVGTMVPGFDGISIGIDGTIERLTALVDFMTGVFETDIEKSLRAVGGFFESTFGTIGDTINEAFGLPENTAPTATRTSPGVTQTVLSDITALGGAPAGLSAEDLRAETIAQRSGPSIQVQVDSPINVDATGASDPEAIAEAVRNQSEGAIKEVIDESFRQLGFRLGFAP